MNRVPTLLEFCFKIIVLFSKIYYFRQLSEDSECRAILVTGIGGAFCNGVDYTVLANDGSLDKQRKNAEALANGIKKLVKRVSIELSTVQGLPYSLGGF